MVVVMGIAGCRGKGGRRETRSLDGGVLYEAGWTARDWSKLGKSRYDYLVGPNG